MQNQLAVFKTFFLFVFISVLAVLLNSACYPNSESHSTKVSITLVRPASSDEGRIESSIIDTAAYPTMGVLVKFTGPDMDDQYYSFSPEEVAKNSGVIQMEVPTGLARTFNLWVQEFAPATTDRFPGTVWVTASDEKSRTIDLLGELVVVNINVYPAATATLSGAISDKRTGTLSPLQPCANPKVEMGFYFQPGKFLAGNVPVTVINGNYSVSNVPIGVPFSVNAVDRTTGAAASNSVAISGPDISDFNLEGAFPLKISPAITSVNIGTAIAFKAIGGAPPYTFAFAANNSGGSLSPTGAYTAGVVGGGTKDYITATDACYFSPADTFATASAEVTVTGGLCAMAMNCPPNVGEDAVISCTVTYSKAYCTGSLTLGAGNTCTGATVTDNGDGTGTYTAPAQGEAAGPGTCSAEVSIPADGISYGSDITIDEVNQAPTIALTCPASVTQPAPINCTISAIDPDLPANTIICSIATDDTCGGTLTGCTNYDLAVSVPAGCRVSVDATDNGVPVQAANDFADVVVNPNTPPTITSMPFNIAAENQPYSYAFVAVDAELDPITLNLGPADTCGGMVTDNTDGTGIYDFTPGAGTNGTQCIMSVQACDTVVGCGPTQDTIIDISLIANWFVNVSAGGTNTGLNWTNAFTNIRSIEGVAVPGDVVFVTGVGGSFGPSPTPTDPVLTLPPGVQVFGGFQGFETYLAERVLPASPPTILDGATTSNHVVVGSNNTRLDGFYVQNGNLGAGIGGAGVYNYSVSNVYIANCSIMANYVYSYGGGILNNNATNISIFNSIVDGNDAHDWGGGIANLNSTVSIKQSTISNNKTHNYAGGGIHNNGGSVIISNSTITGNYARDYGGGGIYNRNSSPVINNTVFSFNTGWNYTFGNGILTEGTSSPSVTNCVFYGNWAGYSGGAIGSIVGASTTVRNSIIWGNISVTPPYEIYGPVSLYYSDVQGAYVGPGVINNNPLFVNAPGGDFHLQGGSPCINTGDPTPVFNDPDASRNDMGVYGGPNAIP